MTVFFASKVFAVVTEVVDDDTTEVDSCRESSASAVFTSCGKDSANCLRFFSLLIKCRAGTFSIVEAINRVDISSFSIGLMLSWITVSITFFSKRCVAQSKMWSSEKGISRDPLLDRASNRSKALFFSDTISVVPKDDVLAFVKRFGWRSLVQPSLAVFMVVERIEASLSFSSMALSNTFGIAVKSIAPFFKEGLATLHSLTSVLNEVSALFVGSS
mmetsp:Transcript_7958/g.17101  ORF Transcript_7958/g.17101 Transcript_7958/m.17101 type:complete len:216 (+) Transcript_7958:304-951(+)